MLVPTLAKGCLASHLFQRLPLGLVPSGPEAARTLAGDSGEVTAVGDVVSVPLDHLKLVGHHL